MNYKIETLGIDFARGRRALPSHSVPPQPPAIAEAV
jgi:hypothetical protein